MTASAAAASLSFSDLGLIDPLQRALVTEGYHTPTPIQAQAIPHLLAGRDVLGCAQTGTGKTAAFALPILDRLARQPRALGRRGPRALILTPTRELALQIGEGFACYGRHVAPTRAVIFGGVGQGPQVDALRRNVDIIVATPGRLLDLMSQGFNRFEALEVFVLDEADRMLDMGFIDPIRRIIAALPKKRQNLMFSATMPPDIATLADKILINPVKLAVTPVASTVDKIAQWVLFVQHTDKRALLSKVLDDPAMTRVLVFTRTKHGANRLSQQLDRGGVRSDAIHGNKSQGARQKALEQFKNGRVRVLVATDIAARGIDVDGITHVVNFDLPHEPESYVHRIGRTARAGAAGVALSFCAADERTSLRQIEKLTRSPIRVVDHHPFAGAVGSTAASSDESTGSGHPRPTQRRGSSGRRRN
ncbi:MAG TPA: DEAD/DEAH box helicase [Polyangia bacterium]|jgi:ATP-dependent RNA helicase RhlE|nr:DEAD/DEAH box helicase [Polyangia bacterium]